LARQTDPVFRSMYESHADRIAARLDITRSSPNAFQALKRKVYAAAKAARVQLGPRPSEARIGPRPPGQEARKNIVGAVLDFPVLLDDSEVHEALEMLQGESARIVSVMRRCMRVGERGEKRLDTSEFLAQMAPPIQSFASARLAAPAHESVEEARAAVSVNAKILKASNVTQETSEIVREQHRVVGDWDTEIELAGHIQGRVRQRHGLDP
jgi:DNA primase